MIGIDKHSQACDELFQHLMRAMQRKGVYVGSSPGYPRAEIVSVNEQSTLDKGGDVRQVLVTIDSMSVRATLTGSRKLRMRLRTTGFSE